MTPTCGIDAPVGTRRRVADGDGDGTGQGTGDNDGTGDDAVRRAVAGFRATDERAEEAKLRFLAELDRLARPCDRHADPVHVTASAIVVGTRGTVLHLHRKAGRWLQPGGHVDAGETPEQAARRETREETGLAVEHPAGGPRMIHLDVHPAQEHLHLDLRYLLVAPDADPVPGPGESPHVRWFDWAEAEAVADAGLVSALRAARSLWEDELLLGAPGRPVDGR